jgi:hypothetical protein
MSSIGAWTDARLKKATVADDTKCFLQQSLKDTVRDLLSTQKLLALSDSSIPIYNNKVGGTRDRFEVTVGNQNLHEQMIKKENVSRRTPSFKSMLLEFYANQFNDDEGTNIKHVLDYKNACIQHVVVYVYHWQKTSLESTSEFVLLKNIAAAASFIVGKKSALLLYIASANAFLPANAPFSPLLTTPKPPEGSISLRQNELGLLLIACVQKITNSCIGTTTVVCEAQKFDQQKAFFFYKRLLFYHVNQRNDHVDYFRLRHPKLFHTDLLWLISTNPVYETNTNILYRKCTRLTESSRAFNFAIDKVFPNMDIFRICTDIQNQQIGFDEVVAHEKSIQLETTATKQRLRSRKGRIATKEELTTILDTIELTNSKFDKFQLVSGDGDNGSFLCLSKIISNSPNRFQHVRTFFAYFLKSISSFDSKAVHFNYQADEKYTEMD